MLVSSQHKGIDLAGPAPRSKSRQHREPEAFAHTHFYTDWDHLSQG